MRPVIEKYALRTEHPATEPAEVEARATGEVKLGKGPFSFSMPSMVAMAIVTTVGGFATSWLTKPSAGDSTQLEARFKSELAVLSQENRNLNAALMQRVSGIETKVDRLQDSQDRMRERFAEELLNRYGRNQAAPSELDSAIGRQLQK